MSFFPSALIDTRAAGARTRCVLRPVLPQDDRMIGALVAGLSPAARRQRFHGGVRLTEPQLRRMSCVDYQQQMALVVIALEDDRERLIADARYARAPGGRTAEFALMVDERWQRQGIGTWALQGLQRAAARAGLHQLSGDILAGNGAMLALARRCGFALLPDPGDAGLVRAEHWLNTAAPAARAVSVERWRCRFPWRAFRLRRRAEPDATP